MKAADIAAIPDKHHGACADLPLAEAAANCRWLSGHCDGAHSRDGAGWSRWDREAGTALADKLDAEWTGDDVSKGRHLSHKYRKQLAACPPLEELNGKGHIHEEAVPIYTTDDRGSGVPENRQPIRGDGNPGGVARGVERPDSGRPDVQRTDATRGDGNHAGITLDTSQRQALAIIRRSAIAILTGGPGTGKTTITQQVVSEALNDGRSIAAMAPTGIAAKRLAESIEFPATTIHAAMGAIPHGEGVFVVQPDQAAALRAADLVIVDEVSMVTAQLFAALLRAINERAQLLLIGDPDQLSPVGSGQPLTDLLASGMVPVARLTTVHRQAEGSRIREACDLVRAGRWYGEAPQADRDADLVWLEQDNEELLADMCEEILVQARQEYAPAEVTLITPRVTGGTAGNVQLRTEELNRRLQRVLNPAAAGSLGAIAAGDPVVCIRNRRVDDVWNGTSGIAVEQDGKLQLRVHEAEQRIVDCIEDCELAYALSVHKYQGSQNRVIVLAAHPSGGQTLTRRLLYTAISRAQERCICLGPREAFEAAATNAPTRKTLLRGLLDAGPVPAAAPRPAAPQRTRSAEVAAAVVARMAAIEPAFELDTTTPIKQTGTATGPRIVIGQPGRSRVAAALGLGR